MRTARYGALAGFNAHRIRGIHRVEMLAKAGILQLCFRDIQWRVGQRDHTVSGVAARLRRASETSGCGGSVRIAATSSFSDSEDSSTSRRSASIAVAAR